MTRKEEEEGGLKGLREEGRAQDLTRPKHRTPTTWPPREVTMVTKTTIPATTTA